MVPGGKDLRYRLPLEDRRPGVLRIFKQAVGEAFLGGGGLLAHDAGQKPDAGIHQSQRGNFPARQHEVAERNLLHSARADQAFVDPLETCADNNGTEAMGELRDATLRQRRPAWAHEQARASIVRDGVERPRKHVRLHYHAGSTAGGRVIDGSVLVSGMCTDVDRIE